MFKKTALAAAYEWEQRTPDRLWMTQPMGGGVVRTLTWKQGMDEARRMAAHLRSLELEPKSHIAILSKNSAWWVLADLAIWMAGHVSIPVFPNLTPETLRLTLTHSDSVLLFVGKIEGFEAMAPGIPEELPRIRMPLSPESPGERWEDLIAKTQPLAESPDRDPDEVATIIYTSGSTGAPKGAMHSFRGMAASAQGLIGLLGLNEHDRLLSYLPIAHVFERWLGESTALIGGMELYYAEALATFVKDLQRARPTLFISVPRLWLKFQLGVFQKMPRKRLDLLLKIPVLRKVIRKKVLTALGLQDVRFAGSGSAPIPGEVIDWYRKLGLELLEGYGMTENFTYSHISKPGQVRAGYVGSPYPGVEHRISPEGEIQMKGPGNMLGYYKMEDATRETFTEDGWLRTGDRGEIDELNRLRITGRLKEQFKTSKGKYVVPAPIENKLLLSDRLEMAMVGGLGQAAPHAVVMLSEAARKEAATDGGRAVITGELAAHLKEVNSGLDHHERLQFLAVTSNEWTVEAGQLTPTMKLKRRAIDSLYGKQVEAWYAAGEPVVWI